MYKNTPSQVDIDVAKGIIRKPTCLKKETLIATFVATTIVDK